MKYITQGQGEVLAAKVSNLKEAVKYIDNHLKEGAWAIKCPNGNWYKWK